ncbi:MAG TPA: chorismate-binding protein, partial [Polyangiaceae bacterium]|nr:chorismate-binding protein [Polyangiaceae bacterium]
MLRARLLSVKPEPLALARALCGRREAFLLWDATGASASYLGCDPLEVRHSLDPEPDVAPHSRGDLGRAPRWLGLLPYEAMRTAEARPGTAFAETRAEPHVTRPSWWRFGAVAEVTDHVRVIGDDPASIDHLCRVLGEGGAFDATRLALGAPLEAPNLHRARITAALELIAVGHIYQVNLARRFLLSVHGHPFAILASPGTRARFPYCAALRLGGLDLVSSSPELFLKTSGRRVYTAPIKGTRPRGPHAELDRALVRELSESEKEAAELTMILDVERNDLGRVAEAGTVRLLRGPSVTTYPTLHHRAALLGATLRNNVD